MNRIERTRNIIPAMKALAVLLSAWLIPLSSFGTSLPDIITQIKPSVVAVGTYMPLRNPQAEYRGTGFVVADGRYIITNDHVVSLILDSERNESVAVFQKADDMMAKGVSAKVVKRDLQHDLCLLRIEGKKLPAMKLGRSSDVREGEILALTGFPIGMVLGLNPVTHRAMISAITPIIIPTLRAGNLTPQMIRRMRTPFDIFQLDAVAFPGNSGSPLYEADTGRVVGVVNSVFVKDSKEAMLSNPSGITYAIPVEYVRNLLKEAGLKP